MVKWHRWALAGGVSTVLLLFVGVWIFTLPVSTHQGVNFQVSTREIPLYVKALSFLYRHYQYGTLAEEITRGLSSERERVLAVFEWTRQNIRRTPEGWTVVDDHILNIVIRGHGLSDQMADVFTTLSTYAGIPAFWQNLRLSGSGKKLVLSFAKVEERWVVFDVANGLIFRNEQGDLASVEEIAADPGLVERTAGSLRHRGILYQRYFEGFMPPRVPDVLRAEKQMPWSRLTFEVRRLFS